MKTQTNNAPKYAFFYLLSLVALIFTAFSTGSIIFQYINKYVPDPLATYSQIFDSGALKFAISAIIIAAPIYFILMWTMAKSLYRGDLGKDSGIRKWLTYFILLVTSIVILGTLIGIINSYLGGDLTLQFILKALTAIIISGIVFSYYFLEIRREDVVGKKFLLNPAYFYGSVALVLASLIGAFILVPSPTETRNQRFDDQVISNFDQIYNVLGVYYVDNGKLPVTLSELVTDKRYFLPEEILKEPGTNTAFVYTVNGVDSFELCATFKGTNKDLESPRIEAYYSTRWAHDAGYQCIGQVVRGTNPEGKPIVK